MKFTMRYKEAGCDMKLVFEKADEALVVSLDVTSEGESTFYKRTLSSMEMARLYECLAHRTTDEITDTMRLVSAKDYGSYGVYFSNAEVFIPLSDELITPLINTTKPKNPYKTDGLKSDIVAVDWSLERNGHLKATMSLEAIWKYPFIMTSQEDVDAMAEWVKDYEALYNRLDDFKTWWREDD